MIKSTAKKAKSPFELETSIATKIPYARFFDSETIETKNGNLIQIIKIEGLLADTLDDELLDMEKNIRNTLLISLTDSTTSFYFHTIRRKYQVNLNSNFENTFLKRLHDKWQNKLANEDLYINEHYLTIIKKPPIGKIARFSDVIKSLSATFNNAERQHFRLDTVKDLNKITKRILSSLSHYNPTKLNNFYCKESRGIVSPSLSFLAKLLNLEYRTLLAPEADLANSIAFKRLFFDRSSGTIAFRGVDGKSSFAAILSIKNYCALTYAGILDKVFDIDAEIIATQSFSPIENALVRSKIKEAKRNQEQSDDGDTSANARIDQILDNLGSCDETQGEHHISFLVHAASIDALEKNISAIDAVLNQLGIISVREDAGILPQFFASLPGNNPYIARKALVSSKNISSLVSFHNSSLGKAKDNHWGEAVTVLETIAGSPYYFNFHVADVGNTYLIGPMGSGKTLLESFLLAESMRFGGKLVAFDKDRGMEIFIRAIGGSYSAIDMGKPTGFAPFQLDDTPENRFLLFKLMQKIVNMQGVALTAELEASINFAIQGAYSLPKNQRILRNIVPFLGMNKLGSIRNIFDNWVNDGSYAWIFDNDHDTWDLNDSVMGFDMTAILSDQLVSSVIYQYLFHRVESMIDGSKMRIIVAEGWRALQDETFSEKIRDWSSTPRKKNAFLVMDTQAPDDIAKSPIACKIIQETVTQIYFANPKANRDDYVGKFKLSEKEYQIIKTLNKDSRFFLLKQGKQSVVVRANLNEGFAKEIEVLSGRSETVKFLDKLRNDKGDDPKNWLPHFLDKVQLVRGSV